MWKRLLEKLNKQRGSATVEAVVGFTGFILVIFTILSLVNLCRAQMLVSSAMDNAAKELSQYAYFYKMSGLQKFSESLGDAATVGKEDINGVIGSVDTLYGSMVEALDGSKESYTSIENATKEGTLEWSDIETAINGIKEDGSNINSSIGGVMDQFEAIGDNPMAYMKSLVAIAGSEGLDLVKSHLIAAPLAKMFVRQQFGGKDHADANLEKLGIKDGLDGMNFKMSSMFTRNNPDDICLVVFYQVDLLQLFDMNVLSIKLSKVSRCGAWLGGDNVQEIVDPTKATSAPSSGGSGGTDSTDATAPEGTTPDSTVPDSTEPAGETTAPTEPTETTAPPIDTTGSYWHLGDGGYGVKNAGVENAFHKYFDEKYNIDPQNIGSRLNYISGRDNEDKTTGYAYKWDYGISPDPGDFDVAFVMSEVQQAEQAIKDGKLSKDTKVITYVVFVPENISEEEYSALTESASKALADYQKQIFFTQQEQDDVTLHIEIAKAGGNYDPNYTGD